MKRVAHIPLLVRRDLMLLTKAMSSNTCTVVDVVATCDAVLGFFCRRVLGCLLDVHARVDPFAAYNGMIRGYTENSVNIN